MTVSIEHFINYSAIIDRPPLKWPNNKKLAVWIAPNLEHYEFEPPPSKYRTPWPRVPAPDVMNYGYRDYGNRVGFWRMLEVFDEFNIKGTVSLNMAVLEHYPQIGEAMLKRDWAFMSHGIYNTRYLFGMSIDEEREFYRDTIDTLFKHTGKKLKGMLGPGFSATLNTPNLMAEAGLTYHVDWFVDDQPFPINVDSGKLVGVPYSRELNDALVFVNPGGFEGEYMLDICKRQFDVLMEEGSDSGRVMCIALHPYIIGQPYRIDYLRQILDYVARHEGTWMTTADEIADHYLRHYHDQELARLKNTSRRI
jgi:peptidoglycan/xylan/chitin deacetylase (PgdA/CDA1 family)